MRWTAAKYGEHTQRDPILRTARIKASKLTEPPHADSLVGPRVVAGHATSLAS